MIQEGEDGDNFYVIDGSVLIFVNTASIHGLSMILLTLRRPLFSYGYSCKTSWLSRNFWHPGTLTLRRERQSARMPKITNDGLTRLFYSCILMATVVVEAFNLLMTELGGIVSDLLNKLALLWMPLK